MRGPDAEGHDASVPRGGGGGGDGLDEGGDVPDEVVRRHGEDERARSGAEGVEGRHRHGRGGIAPLRLQDDVGGHAGARELLGDDEAGIGRGHHDGPEEGGRVGDALGGLLERRGGRVEERGELLRHALARQGPQAGA